VSEQRQDNTQQVHTRFGVSLAIWERTKDEMREVLNAVARRGETITYTDLVRQVHAMRLDPHDYAVAHLLGEISAVDHAEGRGMRSALVISKEEGKPGTGFFALAASCGEDVSDQERFWVHELHKVYADWPSSG
jgi:hypothetical protein